MNTDNVFLNSVLNTNTLFYFQHAENWVPDPNSKTKDEDIDTFIQCVNLLLNLCESSGMNVVSLYLILFIFILAN